MDLPISCQDICHIYKHPLSILIHLKFQDKDGCSKNGSREFLKNVSLLGEAIDPITNPHIIGTNSQLAHFDHRGVAYKLILRGCLERGLRDDELLCELENWRSCGFVYSTYKDVGHSLFFQEEEIILERLHSSLLEAEGICQADFMLRRWSLERPSIQWRGLVITCGFVTGFDFYFQIILSPQIMVNLGEFDHLLALRIKFDGILPFSCWFQEDEEEEEEKNENKILVVQPNGFHWPASLVVLSINFLRTYVRIKFDDVNNKGVVDSDVEEIHILEPSLFENIQDLPKLKELSVIVGSTPLLDTKFFLSY